MLIPVGWRQPMGLEDGDTLRGGVEPPLEWANRDVSSVKSRAQRVSPGTQTTGLLVPAFPKTSATSRTPSLARSDRSTRPGYDHDEGPVIKPRDVGDV